MARRVSEGLCAGCGLPGHRYGTSDPGHTYDAMACVNSLRAELQQVQEVADALAGDLIAEVGHNFSGEYPQPESLDRWRALHRG